MKRRFAVRGIFVHEGKLLCIWHKPYRGPEIDYWCVIGGGVDPGEPLLESLEREITEETGIQPKIGRLIYMQQYIDGDQEQLELFYNILNPEDYSKVDLSKTSHGKDEIEKIEFLNPAEHRVLPEFLQKEDFSKFDPNAEMKYMDYITKP